MADTVKEKLRRAADYVGEKISDKAQEGYEKAKEGAEYAKEMAAEKAKEGKEYLSKPPLA